MCVWGVRVCGVCRRLHKHQPRLCVRACVCVSVRVSGCECVCAGKGCVEAKHSAWVWVGGCGCGWVGGNRGLQSRPVPGCDTKHVEQQCPARRDRDFTSPVTCTRAPPPPPPPLVRVPMMRPAAPHPSSGTRTPRVRLGERGANEGQRRRSRFLAAWTRVVATVANRVEAMGETAVGIVVTMTMDKAFCAKRKSEALGRNVNETQKTRTNTDNSTNVRL
jgi:hypothetical protein